jgi:hypothetical protein
MFKHVALLAVVVAAAGVLAASSSQAANNLMPLTMTNNLTFSKPVSLPGVTLAAGTYVFESGPGGMSSSLVRVVSPNRQRQFYLGFTIPVVRPRGAKADILTFGEAANGAAAPILAWYPVGSNSGHEFMYR